MKKQFIEMSPLEVLRKFCYLFFFLFFLHMISVASTYKYGIIIKKIDFNHELNVPTYYATLQLLIAGYLVWWVSVKKIISKDKLRYYWRSLSFVMYFLAIDEFFRVHDKIEIGTPGGWVKYYFVLFLLVGASYLYFLYKLPNKTRKLMFVSGMMFGSGAMGFELVGAYLKGIGYGRMHILYRLAATVEESLEFLAIILFIYTVLDYITETYGEFSVENKLFNLRVKK